MSQQALDLATAARARLPAKPNNANKHGKKPTNNGFELCVREIENVHIPMDAYDKIRSVHNRTLGHFGVEETLSKLHAKGTTWKHMRGHVRQFIRNCNFCQANSDKKNTVKVPPFTRAAYHPMEVSY
jgi:hypothetical protein